MPVDKNLFLHDLAVVAILKCEALYLKEWLDYHLLAGVDHFYIYDNESPDNQTEIAAPYVKAGLVDYFPLPGKMMQNVAYNDAVRRFKFHCRYMAFIDGDEFIYPRLTGGRVTDIVDEILSRNSNAAGVAVNWHCFGSNGQNKSDLTRGVLERFTQRAPSDWNTNRHVKTVANPRKINLLHSPHFPTYFEEFYSVNENGNVVQGFFSQSVTAERIVINHYHTKSREEYRIRKSFFLSPSESFDRFDRQFESHDRNEVFDDGILRYRAERAKTYRLPDKSRAVERMFNALVKNLSPTLIPTTPPNFYAGKMETFLTCRAVSSMLKTILVDDAPAKFFEEASLKAILKSFGGMSLADARLLISELPDLLSLPYLVVKDIRRAALNIIPQIMNVFHLNNMWRDYVELDSLQRLLKNFGE